MSTHHTEKKPNSQHAQGLSAEAEVFPIYKKAGETLAAFVLRFRGEHSFSPEVPVTYAGRLDPMASGLVLLLVGEMCKQKDTFLGLDKTYTFEVLFGVSTDSFDMLGLITDQLEVMLNEEQIQSVLSDIQKMTVFPYPPFSSKPVDGVPLFTRAKVGTLPKELPIMTGEIKELTLKNVREEMVEDVVTRAIDTIKKVEGDFRQEEILEGWQKFLVGRKDQQCTVATLEATVTTGVYIRTLAVLIGEALGVPSLAYSIKRTIVGEYSLENK